MALHNTFKHALLQRERLIGGWFMSRFAGCCRADGECRLRLSGHRHLSAPPPTHDLHGLLRAAAASQTPAVVRMASHDKRRSSSRSTSVRYRSIDGERTRVDGGGAGPRLPLPPFGDRGLRACTAAAATTRIGDYFERINQEVCVIAQLENAAGDGRSDADCRGAGHRRAVRRAGRSWSRWATAAM